jgi:hypothetical protein
MLMEEHKEDLEGICLELFESKGKFSVTYCFTWEDICSSLLLINKASVYVRDCKPFAHMPQMAHRKNCDAV